MISFALFGWLLTLADTAAAGRAYAAHGIVYIAAALTWLWVVGRLCVRSDWLGPLAKVPGDRR